MAQNTLFVFDIETVPDAEAGRKLHALDCSLSDDEVVAAMQHLRRQESGSDFVRLHVHRIVAISVLLRTDHNCKIWSLGDPGSSEADLLKRFFDGIEKYTPTLISWNGGGFDLPVIHYRALLHGIASPTYWDTGERDKEFKWNNYLSRYHNRHVDLMDKLAGFQARANAPLDEIAVMLGLPGKMGMSGYKVWDAFRTGNIVGIRNYCETDVLNTYLVYLRFMLISGQVSDEDYHEEIHFIRQKLTDASEAHFHEFLNAWCPPHQAPFI